jgi:hypothetical protein
MASLKLIITSKSNLKAKYSGKFTALEKLFAELIARDKTRDLQTSVVYIDDRASARKAGITPVKTMSEMNCKAAVDMLFKKNQPAYMMIFGAQDVFPFQELESLVYSKDSEDPDRDQDRLVPSDLPYACEAPYGKKMAAFKNPTRVVGRMPDIPFQADLEYVKSLIDDSIRQKELPLKDYMEYFAVSAQVWTGSTKESIRNIFKNDKKVLDCPPRGTGYTKKQLSALAHFHNCHGDLLDPNYYGDDGADNPVSFAAVRDIKNKISYGTVVAAECCYGAQLLNPAEAGTSIATNYLRNHALAFMGSSTIAYGAQVGQELADLICQYFLNSVLDGASTGRAMLEARQKFLDACGRTLDGHELKTIAQFYLLGDPSLSLVKTAATPMAANTVENRRKNLFQKGVGIGMSIQRSRRLKAKTRSPHQRELGEVLKKFGFAQADLQFVLETVPAAVQAGGGRAKKSLGGSVRFRTFQKAKKKKDGVHRIEALVVKEDSDQLLGWKVYVSR